MPILDPLVTLHILTDWFYNFFISIELQIQEFSYVFWATCFLKKAHVLGSQSKNI